MKIVQTPVRFYPAVGGVERSVLGLSSQLVKNGHQVVVVCANEPKSDVREWNGIRILRLPYLLKIANTNITLSLFFQLMREEYDVIHTHMPTPWCAEMSLLAARLKRVPCVLTFHNDVEKTGLLGVLTRIYRATLLRIVLKHVDQVFITQPRHLTDCHILAPYRHKVSIVPNGVAFNPRRNPSPRASTTLLFVGVLDKYHHYKGLRYLIEAVASLAAYWPTIKLEVVGSGELLEEYRSLSQRLGLEQRICFRGYIDDDALAQLYQQCSVFVLPSVDFHEGFGIVLLEAMAHATPVITTSAVSLSDEIDKFAAGIVVPPRDSAGLSRAVEYILSHPEQASHMGDKAFRLVHEKYLWSEICRMVEHTYQVLIG